MTPEEKIGQLCKGRGFEAYHRSGDKIELAPEWRDFMHRLPLGTVYGVLRADWWTGRDYDTGILPELAARTRNEFQRIAVEETRLGIPILFAEEAPHGLMALGTSVFPTGLGLGSSWDSALLEQIGKVIGAEAASAGIDSVYAPILDLAVDPRWSRVEECFSEDPFLTARLGEAMTRGIRAGNRVEPTLKHFVGGGHSEGGHNQLSAHLGLTELRNCDLAPFRTCIRAGAQIVMSTYHDVDGEPCTGSRFLLTDILRKELGFDGFVTADGGAVNRLVDLRLERDLVHAAARALINGCDGESGHARLEECGRDLLKARTAGLISDPDLDLAVGRLLKIKMELGLFEHPYCDSTPKTVFSCPAHREIELESSRKSLVLLKNQNEFLPFSTLKKLAVIGPNADQVMNQLGDYTAIQRNEDAVSILRGVRELAAPRGIEISFAPGCRICGNSKSGFDEALEAARNADAILFVPGGCSTRYGNVEIDPVTGAALPPKVLNDTDCEKESGEGTDRAALDLSGVQIELFRELVSTGKPIVTVPVLGRPLLLEEILQNSRAVLLAWYPGRPGGRAVAEALFGTINPGGKLPVSLPRASGQLPVFGRSAVSRPDYLDCPGGPLLPFGFGLSYTTFAYSGLRWEDGQLSVEVTNSGKRNGEEVVQFYGSVIGSPIQRPEYELFAFERIALHPGENRIVSAAATPNTFRCYGREGKLLPPPETVRIHCAELSILVEFARSAVSKVI